MHSVFFLLRAFGKIQLQYHVWTTPIAEIPTDGHFWSCFKDIFCVHSHSGRCSHSQIEHSVWSILCLVSFWLRLVFFHHFYAAVNYFFIYYVFAFSTFSTLNIFYSFTITAYRTKTKNCCLIWRIRIEQPKIKKKFGLPNLKMY